jgi:hypothetical protein
MAKAYLEENDPRGKIILEELIRINKDYFQANNNLENNEETLESLFDSSNYPLAKNSMIVKLDLLKKLRKSKLTIYQYFDLIESFFNSYYYNMELMSDKEKELEKYF